MKDVGLWTIFKVVLNHSYPCCPNRAEMLKQHRELNMFVRRTIETNKEAEIRSSKTYQSFVAAAGSHRELSFIEKDVRNYITREVRNISKQNDAKEFGKYLLRMKEKNQNFFFELNLEGDNCIKHAFWADARSKAAFEYFGDVISFDTTYNTNRNWNDFITKYGLKCNKWLSGNRGFNLKYFLAHTFFLKHELVLVHHIFLVRAVRGSAYMDSSLLGSPLLGRDEKHTKEREHAFIFQQVHYTQQLLETIHEAIRQLPSKQRANREQTEREFDTADFHTVIPCATKLAIEAQFHHVYTYEKFREVQAQLKGKVNCITRSMHSTLGFTTYEVVEQVFNSTFNKFFVTYDAVSREVKCQCLLFESRGILCRHSLSVLGFERVDNVIKNIKRRHTHIKSSQDEPLLEPKSKRFDKLVFQSHNICEFVSESEDLIGILHRAFDKVMAEMQEYKGKSLLSHEEVTLSDVNDLQSPPRVKTRGRPKNRLGSNLEKRSQMP
ncbi:hypothetical protein Ahy_B05g076029 [Arachis hypogaea]|uniref:Protein FAR1-RELATED SEQUENCE n=1 Tax=Arachis hypogaea TaxID=3818 RepID=A0A444Z2G5_ARAHY|nr:hypothetical protein Ahy_B05g076029 [Arachis hypogaea]